MDQWIWITRIVHKMSMTDNEWIRKEARHIGSLHTINSASRIRSDAVVTMGKGRTACNMHIAHCLNWKIMLPPFILFQWPRIQIQHKMMKQINQCHSMQSIAIRHTRKCPAISIHFSSFIFTNIYLTKIMSQLKIILYFCVIIWWQQCAWWFANIQLILSCIWLLRQLTRDFFR